MITTSHDRSGAGRTVEGHSPHRRLWSDRFVGRDRQLERIAFGLQSAVDGKPSALVLAFMQWIVGDGQKYLIESGFIPLTTDQLSAAQTKLR